MTLLAANPSGAEVRTELAEVAGIPVRPRFEGMNIGTWLGFKHLNYLVEEAVLDYLRGYGTGPAELYQRYGLCVDIADLDTRIPSALRVDDTATAVVRPRAVDRPGLGLDVAIERDGRKVVGSRVRVLFRQAPRDAGDLAEPPPPHLAPYVVPGWDGAAPSPAGATGDELLARLTEGRNAFGWRLTIPYFYCHFSRAIQMSGYLRIMEEVVHRFLAARGVSVHRLVAEQGWIPAVPHSRLSILDEAGMEEELYVRFTVTQVFKRLTYTADVDCFVVRDGLLQPTATGRITHGYAHLSGRSDWGLVEFDDRLAKALEGEETAS